MFAWIKSPKGEEEPAVDAILECGKGDHLSTCDGSAKLALCQKKTAAKIRRKKAPPQCTGGGSLAICEGKGGTLHAC